MTIEIIESKEVNGVVYRIQLLDDKYTVYASNTTNQVKDDILDEEEKFSAVASFDKLDLAREYINTQGKSASL